MDNEEKKYLMDHEYDGIQEFNFPLPSWWLASFWLGIIFGVGYMGYYIFMNGPSLKHNYYANAQAMQKVRDVYIADLKKYDENRFDSFHQNNEMRMMGQAVFENNCRACHNKNAAGDIGPNLTDNAWIYTDGSHKAFYQFIIEGSPISGMPAWGGTLSGDELYSVTAYIASLKSMEHVDPPAKEPRGDVYE